jgi:hypothetical protein
MDINEFAQWWAEELMEMRKELPFFVDNMKDEKDKSLPEWISIWVAWSELASKEDIERHYGE